MKNLGLTTLLLLICASSSLGQTGSLYVNIYSEYILEDAPMLELFLKDSLVRHEVYDDINTEFNSLKEGSYKLVVKDKGDHVTTYEGISVSNDSTTNIFLYSWNYQKECDSCLLRKDGLVEVDFGILYSEPLPGDNSLINRSFSAYYGATSWMGYEKTLDVGGGFGYYYEQASLDTSLSFEGINQNTQRFMNTGFRLEAKGRLAFFEHRNYDERGILIDIGLAYMAPILFRRVIRTGEFRATSSRIHKYTDFRPFVRVGYAPVTISLEHRLSNFVKDDLPQLPKWSLGFHLLFNQ